MKKIILIAVVLIAFTSAKAQQIIHLNKASFKAKVWNYEKNSDWKFEGDVPVIIDFYADWCGPCKMLAPHLKAIQKQYGKKIQVYKVNVDKNSELADLFKVRSIPTLIFVPKTGKYKKFVGYKNKKQLEKDVEKKLNVK